MEREDDLPLEFGRPVADLLPNHPQSNSSQCSDAPPLLSFSGKLLCCSSACGAWGLRFMWVQDMGTWWAKRQHLGTKIKMSVPI